MYDILNHDISYIVEILHHLATYLEGTKQKISGRCGVEHFQFESCNTISSIHMLNLILECISVPIY